MPEKPLFCLGEAWVELGADTVPELAETFRVSVGGWGAAFCRAYVRAGGHAALLSQLGAAPFGRKVAAQLAADGIDCTHLCFTDAARTPVVFSGAGKLLPYRAPSAELLYAPEQLDAAALRGAFALCFSSGCLLDSPARLTHLKAIAAAQQCAVLLVMHSNKKQGVSDRKRLADSSDIWDMARSVLMMGRSNSDGKIYLSHEKSSYSRPQQTVLLHIEDVELDGVRTAQAVFDGYTDKKDADFIKEPRVRQAQTKEDTRDAILNVLAESRLGSMASSELRAAVVKEIGCSDHTYNRAYSELVRSGEVTKCTIRQRDGRNKWYSSLYCSETSGKVQKL